MTHIHEQEDCIYLDLAKVDNVIFRPEVLKELLVEAKQLATERGLPVIFAVFAYGNLFYVTAESDLEQLMIDYINKNHMSMLIR
jgi:hypothetical protein